VLHASRFALNETVLCAHRIEMQYCSHMKAERNKVDIASVVLFLAEATVVSALWDYFAASHGMLK
jgi:hypothetical protein